MIIMAWKETVTSVTGTVFPGLRTNAGEYDKIIENEVMSNLPLQVALYFNVVFLPVWLVIIALLLYDKFDQYSDFTKFVITVIITAVVLVEMLRLYLGYEGNLRDKIPELAGFWMLSTLLQFPMQTFLLINPIFLLRVLDKIVQTVMFALLTSELVFGYRALKRTAQQQSRYFRILKLKTEKTERKYKNT